ncbi:MAG TPA: OsmC family protein, partial [Bacteroidales bacterium]|nr:OsmC family protein [Bacteroidales bacterium]
MSTRIESRWIDNMTFEAQVNGHSITIDADEAVGGRNLGPRPKPLMLVALAGCTGMDVISILGKMRIVPEYFNVAVEAEMTGEHPKTYEDIRIIYEFRGQDLPMDKLEKAVALSQEKYCGVSAMLIKATGIRH